MNDCPVSWDRYKDKGWKTSLSIRLLLKTRPFWCICADRRRWSWEALWRLPYRTGLSESSECLTNWDRANQEKTMAFTARNDSVWVKKRNWQRINWSRLAELPRLVGTWYLQEETHTTCSKEGNALFSFHVHYSLVATSLWGERGFKAECLSAGQQQVRGRVYNLNKKYLSFWGWQLLDYRMLLIYQEETWCLFALLNRSPQTITETYWNLSWKVLFLACLVLWLCCWGFFVFFFSKEYVSRKFNGLCISKTGEAGSMSYRTGNKMVTRSYTKRSFSWVTARLRHSSAPFIPLCFDSRHTGKEQKDRVIFRKQIVVKMLLFPLCKNQKYEYVWV